MIARWYLSATASGQGSYLTPGLSMSSLARVAQSSSSGESRKQSLPVPLPDGGVGISQSAARRRRPWAPCSSGQPNDSFRECNSGDRTFAAGCVQVWSRAGGPGTRAACQGTARHHRCIRAVVVPRAQAQYSSAVAPQACRARAVMTRLSVVELGGAPRAWAGERGTAAALSP